MLRRPLALLLVLAIVSTGCGSSDSGDATAVGRGQPDSEPTESFAVEPAPTPRPGEPAEEPPMDPVPDPAAPPAPGNCADGVPSSEILTWPEASLDETRGQLPLMQQLQQDTKLLWQEFGIQPDHMMVDGLPRMLVQVDDDRGGLLGSVRPRPAAVAPTDRGRHRFQPRRQRRCPVVDLDRDGPLRRHVGDAPCRPRGAGCDAPRPLRRAHRVVGGQLPVPSGTTRARRQELVPDPAPGRLDSPAHSAISSPRSQSVKKFRWRTLAAGHGRSATS